MTNPTPWELSLTSISAICDAWALDRRLSRGYGAAGGLVFLSVSAPPTTLKGIRAALNSTKSDTASLSPLYFAEDQEQPEPKRGILISPLRRCRAYQRKLATAGNQSHLICLADEPPNRTGSDDDEEETTAESFYLFARRTEDGPDAFYRQYIRRSPTPTLPEWSQHIWEFAEDHNHVEQLQAHGIAAWRCDVDYTELEHSIVTALKRGRLPLP